MAKSKIKVGINGFGRIGSLLLRASILNSKNIKDTLAALKKSAGFIRSELAKRVNLRNTPEIIFELDDSLEYGAKIDSILKEIMPKKED